MTPQSNAVQTAPTPAFDTSSIVERSRWVGKQVARQFSADVDGRARFPIEAIDSLREHGLLGSAVPKELGGGGSALTELAQACTQLGQHCAASAMVLAMHHIQVLSIARHRAEAPLLDDYLRRVAAEQRLIASVTSEAGVGGDLRHSSAAVEPGDDGVTLRKQATTISYGEHADDLLITARRSRDAAPGDQVAVLSMRGQHKLSEVGTWDPLGMRGTCSPPATVETRVQPWQVLPQPFAAIAARTMVPSSHILWAACWLGIALDALSTARSVVRRREPAHRDALPFGAEALGQIALDVQCMEDMLRTTTAEYERIVASEDERALDSLGFAQRVNHLKLMASQKVVTVVGAALNLVGIGAYLNNTPVSLGRQLRDAHSAPLMINNMRLELTNASLSLMQR